MTFTNGWPLLLLVPLAGWLAWEWASSPRRLGLLLKALTLAAVCLALARPQWQILETYSAVAILKDASGSIPEDQRAQQEEWLEAARVAGRGHVVRDLEFGSKPLRQLRDPALGRATNIEAAIRNALSALPADRIPKLLLLSDGQANEGAVERAVYQAWRRKVPVDTVALAGRADPDLRVAGLRLPRHAFAGERFPIEFEVEAPAAAETRLELFAESHPIGSDMVLLAEGRNTVTARASIESPGATLVEGVLSGAGPAAVRFAGAVTIRTPRALLISPDVPEHDGPLAEVAIAAGFDLDRSSHAGGLADADELDYDIVICSNEDFEAWPEPVKGRLETFVSRGGGFLLIAGERNLYRDREDGPEDALHAMLPATLAPPRTPEGTAVVLVVDKSSSMEGKKMHLARQSALGVVENLRPIDRVGVLAFDNSFEWAVPLLPNETPNQTKRLISGIVADGGTQIAPALAEAYRAIKPQDAVYKHILLLTDGISEEGDSITLAREAAANEVTISTIGLGQDVNRSYLERVARSAAGQSYFLLDISALEQIVLRDVMEHTGTSVNEREFVPVPEGDFEVIADLNLAEPGPLLGWVKFEAKPAAETILRAADEDPLLVRWQYGLGRSAVFASDAKDRWATNWIPWPGFDSFWANVLRDLLPRAPVTDTGTEYDATTDEIVVRYHRPDRPIAGPVPDVFAIGPQGYRSVATPKSYMGGYEARFPAGGQFGLFRIRPAEVSRDFPETALFRESSEMLRWGADRELMHSIAEATGGSVNPSPERLFETGGRTVARTMDLWPVLLALAILLNLIELVARKGWLPILGRWA